uniref:Delta6 fatty acid desaturase putative n=1 Tax=Albugo laibachii Nc14 TaxID=890382 RepID=F0WD55_9STRA|nr:delta6 fatty acid desaturase putative [Albugo laibachii Nc14]|eukprot:CCA19127.1 delta6 fatty acid desaturase putative [Albugo laibachii Nc14]
MCQYSSLSPKQSVLTWDQVRAHNSPNDAWIVIHNKVYDITNFNAHPGGSVMYTHAGADATDVFAIFHPAQAFQLLKQFYIGEVVSIKSTSSESESELKRYQKERQEFVSGYRQLRATARSLGLYKTSLQYYIWKITSTLAIWFLSVAVCYLSSGMSGYTLSAAIMGLFYQQSGWLSHDVLHHQVLKHTFARYYLGTMVGNLWQGFSVQWWKTKHNTHHAVPNLHSIHQEGFSGDPDIDTMPLIAWSLHMARKAHASSIGAFLVQYQAFFYFPLLLFARVSWLLQSLLYVFRGFSFGFYDPSPHPWAEKSGLIGHYAWNFAVMYYCGMTIWQSIAWFLLSQATCGIFLALVFSIGHNGMAIYERSTQPKFWELQVTTTRNIKSSIWCDWFTGGLNFQVDHHLFPTVPRHNLKKLNHLVKSFCAEYEVPYHETSFHDGIREVMCHLSKISLEFVSEFPAM